MHLKILSFFAAALLLVGCETSGADTVETGGSGSATTSSSIQPAPSSPAPGSQEQLLIEVGDRIFFGYDSSELDAASQSLLRNLAAWMSTYPVVTITIEGHADKRGTREYNLALGERRANAARDFLVASGVNPDRIGVVSYGKERPEVLGDTEQAWAQNRRDFFRVN